MTTNYGIKNAVLLTSEAALTGINARTDLCAPLGVARVLGVGAGLFRLAAGTTTFPLRFVVYRTAEGLRIIASGSTINYAIHRATFGDGFHGVAHVLPIDRVIQFLTQDASFGRPFDLRANFNWHTTLAPVGNDIGGDAKRASKIRGAAEEREGFVECIHSEMHGTRRVNQCQNFLCTHSHTL